MLTKVVHLDRLERFCLYVQFDDGRAGIHDFSALTQETGEAIAPLRDLDFFKRVCLEFGASTWPNGFDIAPEWLHREMTAQGELHRVAAESVSTPIGPCRR